MKRGTERVDTAMWGRALPIEGGTYTISASSAGKKPWTSQITVAAEKDTKTVEVPVLEKAGAPVVTTTTPPKTTPPKTTPTTEPDPVDPQP